MDPDLIRAALDKGERECGWNDRSKLDVLLDALDGLTDPPCTLVQAIENRIKFEVETPEQEYCAKCDAPVFPPETSLNDGLCELCEDDERTHEG